MAKKGHIPWNKNIPMSKEMKIRISGTLKIKYANGLICGFQKGHLLRNNKLQEWRMNGGIPWNRGLKGEKSHSFGRIFSDDRKRKMSERAMGNKGKLGFKCSDATKEKMRIGALNRKYQQRFVNTNIELAMKELLNEHHILYDFQKIILKRYKVDFFILPNIILETDGNYWHKRLGVPEKDKLRDEELTKNGYVVIRFWEKEIINNLADCWNRLQFILKPITIVPGAN